MNRSLVTCARVSARRTSAGAARAMPIASSPTSTALARTSSGSTSIDPASRHPKFVAERTAAATRRSSSSEHGPTPWPDHTTGTVAAASASAIATRGTSNRSANDEVRYPPPAMYARSNDERSTSGRALSLGVSGAEVRPCPASVAAAASSASERPCHSSITVPDHGTTSAAPVARVGTLRSDTSSIWAVGSARRSRRWTASQIASSPRLPTPPDTMSSTRGPASAGSGAAAGGLAGRPTRSVAAGVAQSNPVSGCAPNSAKRSKSGSS